MVVRPACADATSKAAFDGQFSAVQIERDAHGTPTCAPAVRTTATSALGWPTGRIGSGRWRSIAPRPTCRPREARPQHAIDDLAAVQADEGSLAALVLMP
jgi:hypothetical protein